MIEPMVSRLKSAAAPTRRTGLLRVTRIRREQELKFHIDAWRTLAVAVPMRSPEWLLEWWRFYKKEGDELCVVLFSDPTGILTGLAPLYIEKTEKQRTVRLLGSGEASTNHTTWLCSPGNEIRIGRAVADFLLEVRSEWDQILLESVDTDDLAIGTTVEHLAKSEQLVHKTPLQNCWKIALPTCWDDYLAMLSKAQRKHCRRMQRQYFDSGLVKLHMVTKAENFPRGFEVLLKLHGARWGEPDRPLGCFSDQRFREFHQAVALKFLRRQQLLLAWVELDGEPIAVEYQLADRSTVYSYLAGMDPVRGELAPGNLSVMAAIRLAIESGRQWFDFSRGDQPYKSAWRATPTSCHDIRIWPDRIAGRLEHGIWGMRIGTEQLRLRTIRWIKARVSTGLIELGRDLIRQLGGRRMGPVKTMSSRTYSQPQKLQHRLLQR
ncbi:MAG: GNAT family N-acetyltransferase, partial [Desulfuromonadaceae bacterium]|nr:GNAT family N-acetyltransferase [Desulfuromonadaceae bacterium]